MSVHYIISLEEKLHERDTRNSENFNVGVMIAHGEM